jgi:hypothetical protein
VTIDLQAGGVYLLTDAAGKEIDVGGVYLLVDVNMLAVTPVEVGGVYLLVDAELDDISADGTATSSGVAALSGRDFFMALTITDGTTTANLVDGINYDLVDRGWAPGVAALRKSTLGGYGPYENVVEEITVNIYGATAAQCLENLATLSQLLDQAERWNRGEQVAAVRLTCQPTGSTLDDPLECVILGRVDQQPVMGLPVVFNDKLKIDIFEVPDVRLRFVRRGLWLEAAETPATSAAVTNPGIATVTYASTATVSSPAKMELTFPTDGAVTQYMLLYANNAARIVFVEAENMAGYQFTSVADAAKIARGGSVLRYTPTDLLSTSAGWVALSTLTTCRRMAVWAAVRNNSGSATWNVRARLTSGTSNPTYYGPEVKIDASSTDPRIVFLGMIAMPTYPAYLNVYVRASTITGPPTLDIDYFALLDTTDEMAGAIVANLSGSGSSGTAIIVDARPLTDPTPVVTKSVSAGVAEMSYLGNGYMSINGTYLSAAFLAVESTYWCSQTTGVADTFTLTGTRWKARTTPE